MRVFFVCTFIVNTLFTIAAYRLLPPKVAMNFGNGGLPNSWGSKSTYSLTFLAIDLFLFFLLITLPYWVNTVPRRWLNLPNKEYWVKEGNWDRFRVNPLGTFGVEGRVEAFRISSSSMHTSSG